MQNITELPKRIADIELSGKTYTITETSLADYAAFKSYLRSRRLKEVIEAAADLSAGERITLVSELARKPLSEYECELEAETAEGVIFMLWRSMLPSHPDLTLDKLYSIMGNDAEKMAEIAAISRGIETPDDEGPESKNVNGATVAK
jgi:hypothetical protein